MYSATEVKGYKSTYEIGRRNFIIVTERIEKHSDWKLSMFWTE